MQAFNGNPGTTVNIDVSATSQALALGPQAGSTQVRVMNNGTATVWIRFGDSAVAATTAAGIPIGPGVTEVFTVASFAGAPYVAAIAAGSTGKIYFTPGTGI